MRIRKGAVRRARRTRRRRPPEIARQELLDAAERVFARFHPSHVGLKEVAHEAGVSHALITHYFGTYGGLVEAALERRLVGLRTRIAERLRDAGVLSRPEELIGLLFTALQDPVHLRLMKWLVASERSVHAFALQQQGLALLANQIANALSPRPTREMVHALELIMLTAVAAAVGYAVNKHALAGAIGSHPSPELDAAVQRTLAGMVQSYMQYAVPLTS